MNPLQTFEEETKAEFAKTLFAKGGGSCFECCDYEGMYSDLQFFIAASHTRLIEKVIEMVEGEREKVRCGKCDGAKILSHTQRCAALETIIKTLKESIEV